MVLFKCPSEKAQDAQYQHPENFRVWVEYKKVKSDLNSVVFREICKLRFLFFLQVKVLAGTAVATT